MIHANCRVRLTADDFSFVVGVLSKNETERVSLEKLLIDEDTRDVILDHEALTKAILNSPERLPISPQFLFYVLCRKVLRETRVQSREASDYVASMLEGFMRTAKLESPQGSAERSMRYISDMMQALTKAGTYDAFILRSHIANYALFMSGIFAENANFRTQRKGAPDISFYEAVGRMNFRAAAEYREAKKFNLQTVYEELADGFRDVRVALNDLAHRLLHIESTPGTIIAT